jgi:pyruvate/2-oxoglutarate dehydrogenase complex dihydrolipoamide acyltransferase (E2) component
MATSADKLSQILELACNLSREGKDNEAVMFELAKHELLPKKLLPKEKKEVVISIFASKQAEALAVQAKLTLEAGAGSGKDGKYTLADINKRLSGPKHKPTPISPSALQLANENSIDISAVTGTGKEGRIVLKDIEALLEKKDEPKEISISPMAVLKLEEAGYSKSDLAGVIGTGKEGRILQKDVEEFIKQQKGSDTDDNDTDDE